MVKPASFIVAASMGFTLMLAGGVLWLHRECPGRVAAATAAAGGPALFKLYHLGENPWVGTWLPEDASVAAANGRDGSRHQRLADHSPSTDSCDRDADTAKPRLSS